jgi:PAS domain S-box-containing protein
MKTRHSNEINDLLALKTVRWLSMTHGAAMVIFVALVAGFLWYARRTGLEPTGDGILGPPMQAAIVGLSLIVLAALFLLGRNARHRLAAELARDRLFTLSPDPLCVMRPDGRVIRGNPAFETFFDPDGSGRRIIDCAHPEDRVEIDRIIEAVATDGAQGVSFEARFVPAPRLPIEAPDGVGWRWLQWSIRRDPQAYPTLLYAIARDTTERREAEAALAAETAFRQAMEDSMVTGMRAFDLEGRITYVNRAFCDMVGFPAAELIGKSHPFPYWPDNEVDLHRGNLARVLAGDINRGSVEARIRRSDGKLIDTKIYVSRLVDRNGQHTGWMTSINDITEPRRIRAALAAAHERFTTVMEALDAAVSVVGGSSSSEPARTEALLFANRMYREWFGDAGESHRTLRRIQIEAGNDECYHPQLNRWFELRARTIRWVDGSAVEMLVATDVTARREADETLQRQEQKLQQNVRLVTMGEMASSLAHELNQPLTAIANYCSGLRARLRTHASQNRPIDTTMLLDVLGKTTAQADRAGEVIRRIRNFVKRSEPERKLCQVADFMSEALGLAQIDAKRHRVKITSEVPDQLPPLDVDRILMQQVMLNLLKNAVEASRDASTPAQRQVKVAVEHVDHHLQFSVTDRGTGVRDDIETRLFEPFFSTKPEGMGIGLNICRSIIEAHQGRLWHERMDDCGTRFVFTLPIAREDEPSLEAAA